MAVAAEEDVAATERFLLLVATGGLSESLGNVRDFLLGERRGGDDEEEAREWDWLGGT